MKSQRDECFVPRWLTIGSLFALMLSIFALSPVLYMWIVGLSGCFAIGFGSVIAAGTMFGDGFLGWYFGMKLIEGCFQVIIAILQGMAAASR